MLLALLLAASVAADSGAARADSLRAAIEQRIAAVPGARVGVVLHDLADRFDLRIAADSSFHAASTMKVPVMIELFRRIDAGALSLDQKVLLVNQFGSIVDGSPYSLDAGEDSDSAVYARVGQRVSVGELIEHMIIRSSNLATNTLIALVGAEHADSTAHALGATRMRVLRGVEDQKAYDLGRNNTTTAGDLAALMLAIERGQAASKASCARMRDILLREVYTGEIPAGLPPGTPVAQKTGWITATLHDAAIVYPPGRTPYVLVVLTSNIPDEKVAGSLIADISRLVWAYTSTR
ncbi:MAG: serine hydrolase [Gemmatimonadaceae bacterium]|nr:serine hydrolase [Gemmatimonadaceae bacterium]NUQ92697.1 serine hydrolase [Gemmatimonadaceae bacterium]NUS97729.1 serine hydrolase [Gemmatimonadaceae bacterium]